MVRLVRLLSLPLAAALLLPAAPLGVLAQIPDDFELPETIPTDKPLSIDGDPSLVPTNVAVAERFTEQYPNTPVRLESTGSEAALDAVRSGDIDIAAMGRPLTDQETATGLVAVPFDREKIAIIIGPENSFDGDLTFEQFAQIFRGEITDWSEVGGEPGPIRFVDRPNRSDTRQAFQNYPVFEAAPFETGATAESVETDSTDAVVAALGTDGVGYAIATQVLDNPNVTIVPMHQTLPDDPRYPFSQPRFYVYQNEPTPAAQAFLGLATNPAAIAPVAAAGSAANETATGTTATTADAVGAAPAAADSVVIAQAPDAAGTGANTPPPPARQVPIWWWLLPAALIGVLLWALLGRRSDNDTEPTEDVPHGQPLAEPELSTTATVDDISPAVVTPADAEVPNRAQTIVSADRDQPLELGAMDAAGLGTAVGAAGLAGGAAIAGAAARGRSEAANNPAETPTRPTSEESDSGAAAGQNGAAQPTVETTGLDNGASAADRPTVPSADAPETVSQASMPTVPDDGFTGGIAAAGAAGLTAGAAAKLYGQSADETATETTDLPDITPEPMDELVSEVFSDEATETDPTPVLETSDVAPTEATTVAASAAGLSGGTTAAAAEPTTSVEEDIVSSDDASSAGLPLGAISATGLTAAAVTQARSTSETTESTPETPTEETDNAIERPGRTAGVAPLLEPVEPSPPESDVLNPTLSNRSSLDMATLATVDDGLPELPDGYNESRIVLMPRDPQWAYAYWDVPNAHKEELRNQGGRDLALRLYDVSDVDLNTQAPHNMQQYYADEMARSWYLPIPVSDRDYIAEIGYLTADGRWLVLARSAPAHIPPVFPSDWIEDQFLTLDWDEDLRGKTFATLIPPGMARPTADGESPIHDAIFARAGDTNALRVAGSLFGSMQQVPASVISSFAIPSGLAELPGIPGAPVPNFSGLNMSGLNMSGIGFSANFVTPRPRKFWLVADAELIVYGATEPDATVTIGGQQIELSPDGTFRFHMSFQDSELAFPIQAVASDGEQTREVEMDFKRETPQRNTNTKDEADLEWFE